MLRLYKEVVMKKLLILALIPIMFILAVASVSAQDVNPDDMSNEELLTLLMQIMQKLDSSEEETAAQEPTPLPTPTATPQPELTDDKAELEALLTAVMQRLQQYQGSTETGTPEETPVPANDTAEAGVNSIWDNKKLLIEALPSYMFIQPTREPARERDGSNTGGSNNGSNNNGDPEVPSIIPTKTEIEEYEGTPCGQDGSGRLHYADGRWYCKFGG